MAIKRFTAASARDAMAQVKRELGEDALIISNRALTGGRVEILAAAPDAMDALVEDARAPRRARDAEPRPAAVHAAETAPKIESFNDFLKRQGRTRSALPDDIAIQRPVGAEMYRQVAQEAAAPQPAVAAPAHAATAARAQAAPASSAIAASIAPAQPTPAAAPAVAAPVVVAAVPAVATHAIATPVVAPAAVPTPAVFRQRAEPALVQNPVRTDTRLLEELQGMRALLLEQMATMSAATSAAELQKRSPVQVRVMTRLLSAGFSTEVARHITEHLPVETTLAGCEPWLHDVLALNLRCAAEHDGIIERGGVFALVGPTGVGKTTTVAKLAARFAVRYGAAQLGLVTLDAYRVGAHEQLRTYGRILGTPVHLAQDAVTLAEVLAAMSHKRLVLIDTCGVSQRDDRLGEMLATLEQAGTPRRPVQRVLLLNAASHAETLEAVARAWRAREAGAAILTKLDEAARIGGALDSVLRHKLVLMGATHGQRVPEDWLAADAGELTAAALAPGGAPFALNDDEAALLATSPRALQAQAFA